MNLQTITTNKHTSIAAALYALCELASVWLPDYIGKLELTQQWVLVYGLLFAGDAKEQPKSVLPIPPPKPPPPPNFPIP